MARAPRPADRRLVRGDLRRADRGRLPALRDPDGEGIRICIEQVKELKEMKGIRGIHLMGVDLEEKFARIVDGAGLLPRPKVE